MGYPSRREEGFTLIEIIAVLVILGILIAVAIPRYQALRDEAGRATANSGISAAMSACGLLYHQRILDGIAFNCNEIASRIVLQGVSVVVAPGTGGCAITATHTDTSQSVTGFWTHP